MPVMKTFHAWRKFLLAKGEYYGTFCARLNNEMDLEGNLLGLGLKTIINSAKNNSKLIMDHKYIVWFGDEGDWGVFTTGYSILEAIDNLTRSDFAAKNVPYINRLVEDFYRYLKEEDIVVCDPDDPRLKKIDPKLIGEIIDIVEDHYFPDGGANIPSKDHLEHDKLAEKIESCLSSYKKE